MQIVADESPLRRLPSALNLRQRILLDGIRYAVEMGGLSYSRLLAALRAFSTLPNSVVGQRPFAAAFADAWCFVDAVNRLTKLIQSLPGAEHDQGVQAFLQDMRPARDLRNSVQHITARVDHLVATKQHAWGAITWVTISSKDPMNCVSHLIAAGSMYSGYRCAAENPAGKLLVEPISQVTLRAHGIEVIFEQIIAAMRREVRRLESMLSSQFSGFPTAAADLHIQVRFSTGNGETMDGRSVPNDDGAP
jgi:hypothetical protein